MKAVALVEVGAVQDEVTVKVTGVAEAVPPEPFVTVALRV